MQTTVAKQNEIEIKIKELANRSGLSETKAYKYLDLLIQCGYTLVSGPKRSYRIYTLAEVDSLKHFLKYKDAGIMESVAARKTVEDLIGQAKPVQLEMPVADPQTMPESVPVEGGLTLSQLLDTLMPGQIAYSVTDKNRKFPIQWTNQGLMRSNKEGQEYHTKNTFAFAKGTYYIVLESIEGSWLQAMKAIEDGHVARPKGTQEWLTVSTATFNFENLRGTWEIKHQVTTA